MTKKLSFTVNHKINTFFSVDQVLNELLVLEIVARPFWLIELISKCNNIVTH